MLSNVTRHIYRLKKLIIFLFVVAFWPMLLLGQNTEWQDPGYDTNYIKSFREYFVLTLVSANTNNNIAVTDTTGQDVNFASNLPFSFGLALDYRWFTAEYTSTFGRTGNPKKGETSMRSFGFGLTGRKLWFRNFYQKTQGYYVENPWYFNPNFNPEVDFFPSRSDVTSTVYYANLNYGFNHRKFSNMAALWQLERQKKSAGSFTVGATLSLATYSADSALIPSRYQDLFEGRDFVTNFEFALIGLNGGYLHTFAFGKQRKLFVNLAFIPGLSYQAGTAYSAVTESTQTKRAPGAQLEGRLVFGYNGDRWYGSMSSVGYVISTNFEETNPFSQGYSFFRFVVGYKFLMPEHNIKLLKKIGL